MAPPWPCSSCRASWMALVMASPSPRKPGGKARRAPVSISTPKPPRHPSRPRKPNRSCLWGRTEPRGGCCPPQQGGTPGSREVSCPWEVPRMDESFWEPTQRQVGRAGLQVPRGPVARREGLAAAHLQTGRAGGTGKLGAFGFGRQVQRLRGLLRQRREGRVMRCPQPHSCGFFFWGGLRILWGCTCIWRWLEPPGLFSVGGGGLCSSCTG